MDEERFDVIVIGAGQAGPSLAARCGDAGMRVALIERHLLGGTCVNTGCYPTKTLVASARAVHLARRGDEFGFETGPVRVDMRRVKARMDGIVGAARADVEKWVRGMKGVEWITGHARFTAPRTVRVGQRELKADRIFINVGARAARPPLEGIDTVSTLDNASVLQLQEVPRHLVIVGGSYIGLEFAQLMRRFGAEVSVVERSPRLLPREDTDVAEEVQAILEREGVSLPPGVRMRRVRAGRRHGPRASAMRAARLLAGRQPRAARHGPHAEYRRPGAGIGRNPCGPARVHRGGRPVPHQRRRRLGRRRMQRPRRLHAHGMERPRDRRREPAATARRAACATGSPATPSSPTRPWAAPA